MSRPLEPIRGWLQPLASVVSAWIITITFDCHRCRNTTEYVKTVRGRNSSHLPPSRVTAAHWLPAPLHQGRRSRSPPASEDPSLSSSSFSSPAACPEQAADSTGQSSGRTGCLKQWRVTESESARCDVTTWVLLVSYQQALNVIHPWTYGGPTAVMSCVSAQT